jgi:voltage-gated potassium channel
MWRLAFAALGLSVTSVFIHSVGGYGLVRWIVRALKKHPVPTLWHAWRITVRLIVALLLLHSLEVAVWAEFYLRRHCFSNAEAAYYYSLTSYTTLGYGDVVLAPGWRILGGCEAMIGVLMFGWSTASLVNLLRHLQDVKMKQLSEARGQFSPAPQSTIAAPHI